MSQRTIQSPGVEINEVDLSLRSADKIGTTIFVAGFSPQGPSDEIIQVSSLSEFESIYGQPTNSAERYFYHTIAQSFNSRANIMVNRLPYGVNLGDGFTNKYFATVYPGRPINKDAYENALANESSAAISEWNTLSANIDIAGGQTVSQFSPASSGNTVYYFLGKPTFLTLTQAQYQAILDDSAIAWIDSPIGEQGSFSVPQTSTGNLTTDLTNLGGAAVILLNTAKTTVNSKLEGYYSGLIDNTNIYPTTNYDDFGGVNVSKNETLTTVQYDTLTRVPTNRLNFALSAAILPETVEYNISEVTEKITSFNVATSAFDDTLVHGLYKFRTSVFSPEVTKLDFVLEEGYFGSIDYFRQINNENGGQPVSYYLPQKLSNKSVNTAMKINPYVSGKYDGATLSDTGEPFRKVRIMNDGLINRTYTNNAEGDYGNIRAYREIVGFNQVDVADISSGNYIINSSDFTYGTTFGMGFQTMLPAAVYSTNDRSTTSSLNVKAIGNIPGKLDRVFDRLANQDIFDIDIIPEAGLGTIQTTIDNTTNNTNFSTQFFDDRDALGDPGSSRVGMNQLSATSPSLAPLAVAIRSSWNSVQTKFITFAQNTRKDFIYVSDPIRQIFVQGENSKVINIPGNTFPVNILQPLKNCYSLINTNYAAAYATWTQVFDNQVSGQTWIPMSGLAAAKYAQTDANFAPWYAPAGFTRGLLDTVNDVAIYPNQKQRDSIYDQTNTNPVAFFPSEGFVIYGQKTLQTKPSAFDRINVRRLFLYLEKRVKETVKYFVFEPNTLFTRTNVLNVLNPIMEDAKNNEGLYDYLIVCDERNNTPEVIDANELVVDIYLKPVRAAEFILVNFYATRTGQDFSEIVG